MSDIDISRERIERLQSIGSADYLHMALLDRIKKLEAANLGLVRMNEATEARAKTAEAKLSKAVDVIAWALSAWDDHNKYGHAMQGDWVYDARAAIAEINGGGNE